MATAQSPSRRVTVPRALATIAVIGIVAMWGYVLYLALGPGRKDPIDRLDDPAFAAAAQQRCSAALDDVARLPRASDSQSPAERADVVVAANALFSAMIDDLEAIAPPGEDGVIVGRWLRDWRTYLGDREAYAEAVRTDPGAHLLVTARDNDQVTEFIDSFAADNAMISCGTPIDL